MLMPSTGRVAVDVGAVDVDEAHIGVERGHRGQLHAREGTDDLPGRAVFVFVRAHQRAHRQEGDTHCGRLVAPAQGGVAPLRHAHLAALHVAPCVGREAAHLQADDVGGVAAVEAFARGQDLEVVRGGMAGKAQVLAPLADDLVQDGGGDAHTPEPAGGDVVAIVDEAAHRLRHGHALVAHRARFVAEEGTRGVDIRGREQLPLGDESRQVFRHNTSLFDGAAVAARNPDSGRIRVSELNADKCQAST